MNAQVTPTVRPTQWDDVCLEFPHVHTWAPHHSGGKGPTSAGPLRANTTPLTPLPRRKPQAPCPRSEQGGRQGAGRSRWKEEEEVLSSSPSTALWANYFCSLGTTVLPGRSKARLTSHREGAACSGNQVPRSRGTPVERHWLTSSRAQKGEGAMWKSHLVLISI